MALPSGGTTIFHAIAIPINAENKKEAENFAKLFLANRFMMLGFTPVQKKVGSWDIKLPNMWDTEAKYYSLMTLMEENGTNKQLDCIPLEPDFVVLDCGCGPGRIAIQAAKRVKKVICLDSSEGMLEECRKNCEAAGVKNVEYVLADWQEAELGKILPESGRRYPIPWRRRPKYAFAAAPGREKICGDYHMGAGSTEPSGVTRKAF